MATMPHRGLLDRIDRLDHLLTKHDLDGLDGLTKEQKQVVRAAQNAVKNARLELLEVRRQIERVGEESRG